MCKLLILLVLQTEPLAEELPEGPKYGFGVGMKWTLLSSVYPCLSLKYVGKEGVGIQGAVTAWVNEKEEGTYYGGMRAFYRKETKVSPTSVIFPYVGLGIGHRRDAKEEYNHETRHTELKEKAGTGAEVFGGIEWYLLRILSMNVDFGLRYAPASLVGVPYRIGFGGGATMYF